MVWRSRVIFTRSSRAASSAGDGEGGGVVDPVADHGDPVAPLLQPAHHVDLALRQSLGDHVVDADLGSYGGSGAGVVPGQQHRVQPEPAQRGDRRGAAGPHCVGHRQ